MPELSEVMPRSYGCERQETRPGRGGTSHPYRARRKHGSAASRTRHADRSGRRHYVPPDDASGDDDGAFWNDVLPERGHSCAVPEWRSSPASALAPAPAPTPTSSTRATSRLRIDSKIAPIVSW